MRELAIVIQNKNENDNPIETTDAIKESRFKNVFVQWYDNPNWKCDQRKQVKHAKDIGLNIIFAHLGYKKINHIWLDDEIGAKLVDEYKKDIKDCKDNGITMVIMHLTTSKTPPMYNELGLERFRDIVKYAKELGVKVAFENTRFQGYLEYVLGSIKDENAGLCFDIGHYHTHFKDIFNFEFFKDRIFAVHLHDNHGDGIDEHLLPYDGNLDWDGTIKKLVENGYKGPVTLESCYRFDYTKMSLEDFYKEAYKQGEKVVEIFDKYDNNL